MAPFFWLILLLRSSGSLAIARRDTPACTREKPGSLASPARWDLERPGTPWSPEPNREGHSFPWRGYLILPVSFYVKEKRVP
jgi:hypothetical protein